MLAPSPPNSTTLLPTAHALKLHRDGSTDPFTVTLRHVAASSVVISRAICDHLTRCSHCDFWWFSISCRCCCCCCPPTVLNRFPPDPSTPPSLPTAPSNTTLLFPCHAYRPRRTTSSAASSSSVFHPTVACACTAAVASTPHTCWHARCHTSWLTASWRNRRHDMARDAMSLGPRWHITCCTSTSSLTCSSPLHLPLLLPLPLPRLLPQSLLLG
ncbi:unnamed protein product [Closterium sp. NIES-53]